MSSKTGEALSVSRGDFAWLVDYLLDEGIRQNIPYSVDLSMVKVLDSFIKCFDEQFTKEDTLHREIPFEHKVLARAHVLVGQHRFITVRARNSSERYKFKVEDGSVLFILGNDITYEYSEGIKPDYTVDIGQSVVYTVIYVNTPNEAVASLRPDRLFDD